MYEKVMDSVCEDIKKIIATMDTEYGKRSMKIVLSLFAGSKTKAELDIGVNHSKAQALASSIAAVARDCEEAETSAEDFIRSRLTCQIENLDEENEKLDGLLKQEDLSEMRRRDVQAQREAVGDRIENRKAMLNQENKAGKRSFTAAVKIRAANTIEEKRSRNGN